MRGAEIREALTIATVGRGSEYVHWREIVSIERRARGQGAHDAAHGLHTLPMLFSGKPELARPWYEGNIADRSASKMCGYSDVVPMPKGEELAIEGAKDHALACQLSVTVLLERDAEARAEIEALRSNLFKLANAKLSTVSEERENQLKAEYLHAFADGERLDCVRSVRAKQKALALANAEMQLATCGNKTAVEGARELVRAFHYELCAEYADDFETKSSEREEARRFIKEAYMKLAAVDAALARKLVMAAREKHSDDGQLYGSIGFSEKLHQEAVLAQMAVQRVANSSM